jgi:signal peptidase I
MNKFPICYDRDEDKESWLTTFVNVVLIVLIVILMLEMMFYTRFTKIYVVGKSMYPTFSGATDEDSSGGDYIFVDRYGKVEKGDIVIVTVYDPDQKKDIQIIKRVIATEYDTVELIDGVLYLNDEMVEEDYVFKFVKDTTTMSKITVEANHIFVMGDNRPNSYDSRNKYGTIDVGNVLGVMPKWSYTCKSAITAYYTFFDFTVPGLFKK